MLSLYQFIGKTELAVTELLRQFKDRFGDYPKLAQFDDGLKFYNVGVKSLLDKHDVKYFSTKSDKKAAIVERFNRTVKTAMWKYFYIQRVYKWIDILDDLVSNYNNTKHSTILMKPKDVNSDTEGGVWNTLFGHDLQSVHYQNLKSMIQCAYRNTRAYSRTSMKLIGGV